MRLEIEQILSVLRNYTRGHVFAWDTENQGNFNFWNLLRSQGFVQSVELKQAITNWKNIERRGTPTNPKEYPGYEYPLPRRQRQNSSWTPYLQAEQFKYYNALGYFLKNSLQNLEVYSLSNNFGRNNCSSKLDIQPFKIYIIVGQTLDLEWICLAPTVPDQLWQRYSRSYHPDIASLTSCKSTKSVTRDLHGKISKILGKLKPIEIYGYYYGAYNYRSNHQIFCTASPKKFRAIELALKSGKMLDDDIYFFNMFFREDRIKKIMRENLRRRHQYMLSFWDIGYAYNIGWNPYGEWICIKYENELEYNP